MPPADLSAVRSPAASRLFVYRAIELGWIVFFALLLRVMFAFGGYKNILFASDAVWLGLSVAGLVLLVGLRREIGPHPAAGLLGVAVGIAAVHLGIAVLQAIEGAADIPIFHFTGEPARTLWIAFSWSLALAADVVFWLALERLGGVDPALAVAFYTLRFASAALGALSLLPFDTYRSLVLTGILGTLFSWIRLALTVGWTVPVLLALQRIAQRAPVPVATSGTAGTPAEPGGRHDLLVGGLWLAGGLLATVISFSVVSGAGGGRYVVTIGPIVYGLVRMVRGMTRRG